MGGGERGEEAAGGVIRPRVCRAGGPAGPPVDGGRFDRPVADGGRRRKSRKPKAESGKRKAESRERKAGRRPRECRSLAADVRVPCRPFAEPNLNCSAAIPTWRILARSSSAMGVRYAQINISRLCIARRCGGLGRPCVWHCGHAVEAGLTHRMTSHRHSGHPVRPFSCIEQSPA
jgi:hypothetical protein